MQGGYVSHYLLQGGDLAYVPVVLPFYPDVLGIRAHRVSTLRFRKGLKADGKTYSTVSTWRAARLRSRSVRAVLQPAAFCRLKEGKP